MELKKAISTAFLAILLLAAISEAKVGISLPVAELSLGIAERKSIDVTIKNFQDKEDLFSILVWPPIVPRYGIQTDIQARVRIAANSEIRLPLTFIAPTCTVEGSILFEISASSLTDEAIRDIKTLTLRVRGEGLTCITDLKINKLRFNPGEEVIVSASIGNFAEEGEFALEVEIKKDGETIKSFRDMLLLKSRASKELEYRYALPERALAGVYAVEALLKKADRIISSRIERFDVSEIEKLDSSHLTGNLLLFQWGSIKIKNLGNVPSSPRLQNLIAPSFMQVFFYPHTKLAEMKVLNGQAIYSWEVPSLQPLQEYEIKYEFRFWPIWAGVAAAVVAILFVYFHLYSIRIIKKIKPVGLLSAGEEIPITLSIANSSVDEIRDILVSDLVPPIASVVERFETLPPVRRRTRAGTQLNWRIDSLKPGEEVILSYRIRPIVDILGTLKLPAASVRFILREKRKKILVSKPIVVAPA